MQNLLIQVFFCFKNENNMNFNILNNKRLYLACLLMFILDLPTVGVLFVAMLLLWIYHVIFVILILLFSKKRVTSLFMVFIVSILIFLFKIDYNSPGINYPAIFFIVPLWIGVLIGFKSIKEGDAT